VHVYAFGAPRAGNRAFARAYARAAPDTWHVINDQDTVPRGGKFLALYKRNGHRAVVNAAGDLNVLCFGFFGGVLCFMTLHAAC
jgi:hypothetical protein